MSCHENELQREREYEEFMDAFEVVDKKVQQALLRGWERFTSYGMRRISQAPCTWL